MTHISMNFSTVSARGKKKERKKERKKQTVPPAVVSGRGGVPIEHNVQRKP